MFYQPPRALGLIVGGLLTFWAAAIGLVMLNFALQSELGPAGVVTYAGAVAATALGMLFAYWTYSLATLSYALDRNGLVITWGATKQVIPLGEIERLVPGTSVGVPRVQGVTWLGYHVGRATIRRIGDVLFYSTHQAPEQVLYVMTSERSYAISVPDPAAFAHEIQVRQDLGPTAVVRHHVQRSGAAAQAFWRDRTGRILALVAAASGVAVWLVVAAGYGGLPEEVELHYPLLEELPLVTLTGRDAILELPRTATLLLAVNLLAGFAAHAWDRVAGYVLFLAAAAIQAAFVLAALVAFARV